jgi:hypothetical protein
LHRGGPTTTNNNNNNIWIEEEERKKKDEETTTAMMSSSSTDVGDSYYADDDIINNDDDNDNDRTKHSKELEEDKEDGDDDDCCSCCCSSRYCKNPKMSFVSVVATVLYWMVLYVMATSYNPGNHRFTLTVGETWQILPPINLWSRTSLQIQSFPMMVDNNNTATAAATATTTSVEVYEFLPVLGYKTHAPCPALTLGDDTPGVVPIVTLHESNQTFHLTMGSYEYDYFHLNEGSIVHVEATITHPSKQHDGPGATNIYILQGYHTLEALETKGENSDVAGLEDFRGKSVWKRFVGYSGSTDLEFTVPASDYYIIVYDNAAPGRTTTHLQVSVTVQMAAHFLPQDSRPICSAKDSAVPRGCAWYFSNDQDRQRVGSTCIIVKAVSPQLNKQLNNQLDTANEIDNNFNNNNNNAAAAAATENAPSEDQTTDDAITVGTSNTGDGSSPKVDLEVDDSQVVIVQIDAPVGSAKLIFLALLPIIIVTGLWFLENGQKCIQLQKQKGRCCFRKRRRQTVSSSVDERTPLNGSSLA